MKKNILISILVLSHINGQGLDERYHSVVEINTLLDSLDQLEELNGWFRVDTIGFSTQEQIPILAVKISDNVNLKEDEPQVLFVGQVHAEEVLESWRIVDDLICTGESCPVRTAPYIYTGGWGPQHKTDFITKWDYPA